MDLREGEEEEVGRAAVAPKAVMAEEIASYRQPELGPELRRRRGQPEAAEATSRIREAMTALQSRFGKLQ